MKIQIYIIAQVQCARYYAIYHHGNARLEEDKLESRLLGEISITSDMQMTPPLWEKGKKN